VKSELSMSVLPVNSKLGALAVAAPKEFRSNTLLLIVTGSDVGTSVPAPTVMPAAATVIAEFASLAPPLIVKLGELIVAAASTVVVNVDATFVVNVDA